MAGEYGVNIDRSDTIPKDVVTAMGSKLKEAIELKDGGKMLLDMKSATVNDPWLFIEAAKKMGVSDEKMSALIASDIGTTSEKDTADRLTVALRRTDPTNMESVS